MPNTGIKLIATDLDGTLLRDDHLTLSPANREALTSAAKAGIEVVIATGRSLAAVAPQVLELPFLHYFITCNGSITTDREGHILRAAPLPLDTTLENTLSPTGLSPSMANHSKLLDWNVLINYVVRNPNP